MCNVDIMPYVEPSLTAQAMRTTNSQSDIVSLGILKQRTHGLHSKVLPHPLLTSTKRSIRVKPLRSMEAFLRRRYRLSDNQKLGIVAMHHTTNAFFAHGSCFRRHARFLDLSPCIRRLSCGSCRGSRWRRCIMGRTPYFKWDEC